jgi:hypothetical protein
VQLTLVDEATGFTRSTTSNQDGEYAFAALAPGSYRLRAVLPGFTTLERGDIRVSIGARRTLDLNLVVGSPPGVPATRRGIGETLGTDERDQLPAPSRNGFSPPVPGPTAVSTGDPQFDRPQDQSHASFVSLMGGPRRGNNYLIDGASVADLTNRPMVIPTVEAAPAVAIQSRPYDAETSRTGGGVFSLALQSGTNAFHGTGLYQARPVWGQANNWFSERNGVPKNQDAYHRLWSFAASGPIAKGRTFYRVAIEGSRSLTTRNGELAWPTARQRTGDFSETIDPNGLPVVIYDPLTTRPDPAQPGEFLRDPFPGNVIPPERISQVGRLIVDRMPTPDADVWNGLANYRRTASIVDGGDMLSAKIDHRVTDAFTASGAFVYHDTDERGTDYFKDPTRRYLDPGQARLLRQPRTLVLNAVLLPRPHTAVGLRYGWAGLPEQRIATDFDLSLLGFPASFVSSVQLQKFPRVRVEGYGELGSDETMGDGGVNRSRWSSHEARAALSRLTGRHLLKVGAEYRWMGLEATPYGQASGTFEFDPGYTRASPLSAEGGNALASLLLGYVSPDSHRPSFVNIVSPIEPSVHYFGGYFQDEWRVTGKVSLDVGLRYEFEAGLQERENRFTVAFDRDTVSPVALEAPLPDGRTRIAGGLRYAGENGFPVHQGDPSTSKFSPRLGTSIAFGEKTTLEGGYGLFWMPWNYPAPTASSFGQIGFSQETFVDPGDSLIPRLTPGGTGALDDPYPEGLRQPAGSSAGLLTGVGLARVDYVSQDRQSPFVHRYSVSLRREVGDNTAVALEYAGARGEDLGYGGASESFVNINQLDTSFLALGSALLEQVPNPFHGTTAGIGILADPTVELRQLLRPYPQFGDIRERQTTGAQSRYHGATARLARRLGDGWGGTLSYTWSRLESDQFGETNFYSVGRQAGTPQDSFDLDAEFGLSLLDAPHKWVVAPILELPWGDGRRWQTSGWRDLLFGGWTVSGLAVLESGFPQNVMMNADRSFTFGGVQRPDRTGVDPAAGGTFKPFGRLDRYIDPAAYASPTPFSLGTQARSDARLRTPWRKSLDVAFVKQARVSGPLRVQLRAEILNVTNTPRFADGADARVGRSTFGLVTRQAGFSRTLQVTVRGIW